MDTFSTYCNNLDSPVTHCFAITPNDNADLPFATRYLYIGHDDHSEAHQYCTVRVTFLGGETVTLTKLQHGIMYPIRIVKVWATGSDTGDLFGMY